MSPAKKFQRYKRMTKAELREVVQCYATAFPDWTLEYGQVFVRTSGLIWQHVGIETQSTRSYRPYSCVGVTPLPFVDMLHQFLDIKHRVVELRAHPAMWQRVVVAMEQQFVPAIRKPLDAQEVKRLCEKSIRDKEDRECTRSFCMLAVLHALLGEREEALSYCDRMQSAPPTPPALAPIPEREEQEKQFGLRLANAIERGREREFLEAEAANPQTTA